VPEWVGRWNAGDRNGGSILFLGGDLNVAGSRWDSPLWNRYDGRPSGSQYDGDPG
jgi:hypothetical protein